MTFVIFCPYKYLQAIAPPSLSFCHNVHNLYNVALPPSQPNPVRLNSLLKQPASDLAPLASRQGPERPSSCTWWKGPQSKDTAASSSFRLSHRCFRLLIWPLWTSTSNRIRGIGPVGLVMTRPKVASCRGLQRGFHGVRGIGAIPRAIGTTTISPISRSNALRRADPASWQSDAALGLSHPSLQAKTTRFLAETSGLT